MEKKKKNNYKLTLEMVGKTYKTEAESIYDALGKLEMTWNNIKSKGVIKIVKGKKSVEQLFYVVQLKRIFGNKLTRRLWAKRLEYLMS